MCLQAGHLSPGQPAADRGLQEPGGRGGEAAPGAVRLREPQTRGDADEGTQQLMDTVAGMRQHSDKNRVPPRYL